MYTLSDTKTGIISFGIFKKYSVTKIKQQHECFLFIENLETDVLTLEISIGCTESNFLVRDSFFCTALNNSLNFKCFDLLSKLEVYNLSDHIVDLDSNKLDPDSEYYAAFSVSKSKFARLNILNGIIQDIDLIDLNDNIRLYLYKSYIIKLGAEEIVIANESNQRIWQHDVSELGSVKNHFIYGTQKGQVKDVLIYNNLVYVLNSNSLQGFDLETGKLNVELQSKLEWGFEGIKMFLYKNKILFVPKSAAGYYVYDIETNSLSDSIDLIIPDKLPPKTDFIATNFQLHGDKLWYVSNRAVRYAASVNPLTGQNIDCIHVTDTKGNVEAPQFYGNKIYIRDTEMNLFIYEDISK